MLNLPGPNDLGGAGLTYPGGTTDFLRADGSWAAPPGGSSAGLLMLKASTVARGSTATTRQRFQTVIQNDGGIFTVTDTAADGTYVRVSEAGWYRVYTNVPAVGVGVKVNATLNNTFSTSDSDLPNGYVYGASNTLVCHTAEVYCNANDYIWIASVGAMGAYPEMCRLTIRKSS